MKYFVWIKNIHGTPEAQIWHDKAIDGNGKSKPTLFIKELNPLEGNLSIKQLSEKYPMIIEAEK